MFHRITLFAVANNKRGLSKVKGAAYIEGGLLEATEAAHAAVGKMDNADQIQRVVIDRDVDPPAGSDPFAAVGKTESGNDADAGEAEADQTAAKK